MVSGVLNAAVDGSWLNGLWDLSETTSWGLPVWTIQGVSEDDGLDWMGWMAAEERAIGEYVYQIKTYFRVTPEGEWLYSETPFVALTAGAPWEVIWSEEGSLTAEGDPLQIVDRVGVSAPGAPGGVFSPPPRFGLPVSVFVSAVAPDPNDEALLGAYTRIADENGSPAFERVVANRRGHMYLSGAGIGYIDEESRADADMPWVHVNTQFVASPGLPWEAEWSPDGTISADSVSVTAGPLLTAPPAVFTP